VRVSLKLIAAVELHNLTTVASSLAEYGTMHPSLFAASNKLRGAVERSGARLFKEADEIAGWHVFTRDAEKRVELDLSQREVAMLQLLALIASHKRSEADQHLFGAQEQLARKLLVCGADWQSGHGWVLQTGDVIPLPPPLLEKRRTNV